MDLVKQFVCYLKAANVQYIQQGRFMLSTTIMQQILLCRVSTQVDMI